MNHALDCGSIGATWRIQLNDQKRWRCGLSLLLGLQLYCNLGLLLSVKTASLFHLHTFSGASVRDMAEACEETSGATQAGATTRPADGRGPRRRPRCTIIAAVRRLRGGTARRRGAAAAHSPRLLRRSATARRRILPGACRTSPQVRHVDAARRSTHHRGKSPL